MSDELKNLDTKAELNEDELNEVSGGAVLAGVVNKMGYKSNKVMLKTVDLAAGAPDGDTKV